MKSSPTAKTGDDPTSASAGPGPGPGGTKVGKGRGDANEDPRDSGNFLKESDTPWHRSRFWLLTVIVMVVCFLRSAIEYDVTGSLVPKSPDLTTLALLVWPVLYAATALGPTAAVITTAWIALLDVPREVSYVHQANSMGLWSENIQIAVLVALAFVVGRQVSAEQAARARAEASGRALLSAEARYRNLFDSNSAPILLVEESGLVVEANPAASNLFPAGPISEGPRNLATLLGPDAAKRLLEMARTSYGPTPGESHTGRKESDWSDESFDVRDEPYGVYQDLPENTFQVDIAGIPTKLRASISALDGAEHDGLALVMLTDVTSETRQRESIEGFAASVVQAQEDERRHIAQELHDGPLQHLVLLCRRIDSISKTDVQDRPVDELREMRRLAESLAGEIRRISRGLRPSVLDDLGLPAAIGSLVEELGDRSSISTSFGVTGVQKRLPTRVELAVFRVAQEALSNAAEHSGASRISVGLSFDQRELRLLVTDDGRGFDPSSAQRTGPDGSMGLIGMRERIHMIGGGLVIHSHTGEPEGAPDRASGTLPGSGTTIDCTVPIPAAST